MDYETLIIKNKLLEEENIKLKEQLQKYTHSQKDYYEKNKKLVIQKAKEGLKKLAEENPDKLKEYRRRAYLKRKEKTTELENNKNI